MKPNGFDGVALTAAIGTLTFHDVAQFVSLGLVVFSTLPLIISRWREVLTKKPKSRDDDLPDRDRP